jgi:2,3-diketo-5-methylthio-1-phosphopentane phosphatase
MIRDKVFKVFIDFDGTITKQDVGEAIFRKFGDEKKAVEIIEKLLTDKISSRQCWDGLCDLIKNINQQELDDFINSMEIDSTFVPFTKYCSENGIEFFVLSDGFDYYIDRIFKKAGISNIKYYANKLSFNEQNGLTADYPYYDVDSPASANCKKNHVITHSSDDDYTIYIGDGNSDKDAAQYCDFIFAKNGLSRFCSMERISFYPFNNFEDVKNKIAELMNKKNLRKRHQAQLKRKAAYVAE